jgi:hypothetical protein
VPRPRLHLIRFHGVLAPHAKLRAAIVPSPAENVTAHSADHAHPHRSPARMSWARLLKRVVDIDIERCPNCGGALKIIAAVEEPAVIARILTHLGLPTRSPAALTGAAAGSVPSGLIPDSTGFTPRADKPARPALARAAIRCRPRGLQVDAWPEKSPQNCQILTQDRCD